jgi:hypothetical protein
MLFLAGILDQDKKHMTPSFVTPHIIHDQEKLAWGQSVG